METMTLEQVRDALRNMGGKPTNDYNQWADAIDAHLRERESAKMTMTDKIQDVFYSAFCDAGANACWDGSPGDLYHAAQKALEAVAPMLARGFNLPQRFVDRVTTDNEDEPPCMGAGAVNELQELADEVEACWLCASNGDGEITLETINNWSGRLSNLARARVPDSAWLDRHQIAADKCPPQSMVVLVSSIRRMLAAPNPEKE